MCLDVAVHLSLVAVKPERSIVIEHDLHVIGDEIGPAYTHADPTWFPDMDTALRDMFQKLTIGSLSGKAGKKPKEDFKINGQYVDEPDRNVTLHGVNYPNGVVGIPYFD